MMIKLHLTSIDFLTYSKRVRHYVPGGADGYVRLHDNQLRLTAWFGRESAAWGARNRGSRPGPQPDKHRVANTGAVSLARPPREGRPRPGKTPPQLPHVAKPVTSLPTTSSARIRIPPPPTSTSMPDPGMEEGGVPAPGASGCDAAAACRPLHPAPAAWLAWARGQFPHSQEAERVGDERRES